MNPSDRPVSGADPDGDPDVTVPAVPGTGSDGAMGADPEDALPRMTLSQHLDELRVRLMRSLLALAVATVVSFVFWEPIWEFVRRPYDEAARAQGLSDVKLLSLGPGEGFVAVLKLSFLAGVVAAAPVVLAQLWGFVAAGLYPHERRIVRLFFPVSLGLFALGILLAYSVLIPFGFRFLIAWNQGMGVGAQFGVSDYVSSCLTAVFAMAILFELPLVMLFVQGTGLVQRATLWKGWRWAVLLAFVVGAFLTPDPSPVTQILMALPMVGLYFLGLYGGRFVGEEKQAFRWYHAWPLVLGAAVVVLLLVFARPLNDWAARALGYDTGAPAPAAAPAPLPAAAPLR